MYAIRRRTCLTQGKPSEIREEWYKRDKRPYPWTNDKSKCTKWKSSKFPQRMLDAGQKSHELRMQNDPAYAAICSHVPSQEAKEWMDACENGDRIIEID